MASLLSWAKKRTQGVVAQVNPFDNGQTYNTVLQNRPAPPPAPSVIHQLGGIVNQSVVQPAHTVYSGVAAPIRLAAAEITHNNPAIQNARMSAPTPLQFAGGLASLGTLAAGGPVFKGATRLTAPIANPFIRTAIRNIGTGAIINPALNVANLASQGVPLNRQNVTQAVKSGVGYGAAFGAAGTIAPPIIKGAIRFDKAQNQIGAVGKNIYGGGGDFVTKPNKDGFDVWTGDKRVGQFVGGAKDQRGNPIGAFRLYDNKGNEHLLANVDPTQLQKNLPSIMNKYGIKPTPSIGVGKNVGGEPKLTPPSIKPVVSSPAGMGVKSKALQQLKNPALVDQTGKNTISNTYAGVIKSLPKDIKTALPTAVHEVRNQKAMETAATKLVAKQPQIASDTFFSRKLATATPDAHAKLGNALSQDAVKRGDVTKVQGIWNELKNSGAQAGQGLRAYYFESKISPDGITRYAQKVADLQGKKLNNDQFSTLRQMAQKVQKLPDGEAKGQLIDEMMQLAQNKGAWDKSVDVSKSVLSLPRAIMASGDLSWGGRQGAVLGTRFPKEWAQANAASPKMAVNPKFFETKMAEVRNLTDTKGVPLTPVFKRMGLDLEGAYGRAEEIFGKTDIAEGKALKKVGIGHMVAGSNRAFSGAASIMRGNVAKKIIDGYGGADTVMKNWTTKDFKDLGRVLNTATGRGHGGDWFEKAAPFLGQTLFSARLWKSRLDLLNPIYYARLSPAARKIAIQSSSSFATVVASTLAAAAAVGANVEGDPRSSDFGKLKVGNTRYDIMGGLQQNIVLAARQITGAKKNSTTGAVTSLTSGKYGAPNRLSVLGDFVQNKENPVLATGSRIIRGQDIGGNPVNPWTEIAKMFIPLSSQDTYSTAKDQGALKGTAMSLPGYLGAGVQTYGATPSKTTSVITPQQTQATKKATQQQATADFNKLKANPPSSQYDLRELGDGSYAYTINGNVKQTSDLNKAKMEIAKAGFSDSGMSYKVIGNNVLRKSPDGTISTISKTAFDYQIGTATLTAQKNGGDLTGYLNTAKSQLDSITKQLQDPNIDPLDSLKLQNDATALQKNIDKYISYGGFTKPKAAPKPKKLSIPKLASTKSSSIKVPKIRVAKVKAPSFKASTRKLRVGALPKTRKLSVSKLPKIS